uniref:Uncharacterized protein n=1 Tax=Anguilla anguilla TaxID=7936 RepID=A0A0E9P6X1_ANGAN
MPCATCHQQARSSSCEIPRSPRPPPAAHPAS